MEEGPRGVCRTERPAQLPGSLPATHRCSCGEQGQNPTVGLSRERGALLWCLGGPCSEAAPELAALPVLRTVGIAQMCCRVQLPPPPHLTP